MIETDPGVIDRFNKDYAFLSNMHKVQPSGIPMQVGHTKIKLPTSEHIYAGSKLLMIPDRRYVWAAETGQKARDRARDLIKNKGRPITYANDEDKIDLMRMALELKFATGTRMASLLLLTGEAILVEGNDWGDNFWGKCPPDNPDGQNHLGLLLMERREDLQAQDK